MPGLFIPFSRWQPQTGRRLEELLQHRFEIYFDLISVSFFPMCVCFLFAYLFGLGVQCQTFCHPLFSRLFFRIAFLACDLHEPFGQRLNSQIDGNLFFFFGGQLLLSGIVVARIHIICSLGYPANDFIVLDVLMWALIVLFECHYVQAALGTARRS